MDLHARQQQRAVQALNAGDTLTDTFTVTTVDGTAQVVTITINGTNDAAVISGTNDGLGDRGWRRRQRHVRQANRDRHAHRHRRRQHSQHLHGGRSPTASTGGYGTFTMTAAGVWTYTLDNTNCAVQALNVCDTLTDTLHGDHHRRHRAGGDDHHQRRQRRRRHLRHHDRLGDRGWRRRQRTGTPTATGTLTDTDVDNTPNTFTAVCAPTASEAGYGTFTMTADGVWTYKLDNANCEVQALNDGDTLTDCFKVTTIDGTAQVVTITINGANDTFHFKDKMSDVKASEVIDLARAHPGVDQFLPKRCRNARQQFQRRPKHSSCLQQWSDTSVWNHQ